MVDATTLSLIATIVQTVVITVTLLVFIFQYRSQERAVKEASYQNLLGRYNDFIMSGSESEDQLFARFMSRGNLDVKDLRLFRRLMISYGIIEEAYELYEKGWIDSEAWEQWNEWLKALCLLPIFETMHNMSSGMFNKGFQAHVTRLLEANKKAGEA